ncbi:hypothetical protein CHUAL_003864 [Chamberlinius hualienensis]
MGRYTGRKCRLVCMFALTSSFFLVEIICGYVTNSMALVADSFHMLSDIAALIIAFLSVKMSPKKWSKNTFGWARAEVLGALVNAVFLVALCFSILVESLKRLYEIEEIHSPEMILYVGASGLLVNLIGLGLFHQHGGGHGHSHSHSHRHTSVPNVSDVINVDDDHDHDSDTGGESSAVSKLPNGTSHKDHVSKSSSSGSMNMRGVFLHVLADALGSVIVVASALVIWLSDWEYKYYVDPVLSIVMVLLILRSVWPLLVESALILLQTVPTHIQVEAIQRKLVTQIDGILAVHEFHVWQLAGDRIIASAHIRCRNLADYMRIAEKVKEFFHDEGIHSTTIQPEFVDLKGIADDSDCMLDCPSDKQCAASTCCGGKKEERESPKICSPLLDNCRQRTGNGTDVGEHLENGSCGHDLTNDMESGVLYQNRPPAV